MHLQLSADAPFCNDFLPSCPVFSRKLAVRAGLNRVRWTFLSILLCRAGIMPRPILLMFLILTAGAAASAQPPPAVMPLNTRQSGADWPKFLGPAGTSVSPEKGLLPWPKQGLRIF